MKLVLFAFLISMVACDSSKSNKALSSIGNSVDPNVQAREVAKSFMKDASTGIDPTKQISGEDLNTWVVEGLLTDSEAQALIQNIQ